jgi:hypothetical protein
MMSFGEAAIAALACGWLGAMAWSAQPGQAGGNPAVDVVLYSDFGAKGDGQTDDIDAIAKAHAHANARGLPVKADDEATYYISGRKVPVVIETDTHFGKAKFIIDDTDVEDRRAHVFEIRSTLEPMDVEGVTTLKRNQAKLDVALPHSAVIIATNRHVKHYIRFGLNQNSGSAQTDVFLVDPQGKVDPNTPILWDFDQITEIIAYPVDPKPLTVTGGHFTTIANQAESKYTYYSRGLAVRRSNVVVDGVEHRITGEGDHGAPYGGFVNVGRCANVTVKNAVLSGHKTYRTIGRAGKPVSMGTYDISVNRAMNVSFVDCRQANDIRDGRRWGIMGSNFCKNLRYERCTLSRFDAHQGVANATILDSTLGHAGINLIGSGRFLMENTTTYGRSLVNLRGDYGSTWQGEFIIRNCVFVPAGSRPTNPALIAGSYSGQHDFGYPCYMPETITIENLRIEDKNHRGDYRGPAIFADFNRNYKDASYQEKYPYIKTKQVILKDVTTASGKPLRLSDNMVMFREVQVQSTGGTGFARQGE